MTVVCVPEVEGDVCRWEVDGRHFEEPWPTLGPPIVDLMESDLRFGPGDLKGEPYRLDGEFKGYVHRVYQVYPRGHPREGQRRFTRAGLSLRKGTAKTELAAAIAYCELSRWGPVRFAGWTRHRGELVPEGRPITDPYIPMVAYTEGQAEELAFGALYAMIENAPGVVGEYDLGLERIMRRGGDGKAEALSSSPNAADGARTTFEHFDETHRLRLPRHVELHRTMLANLPKRASADAWALETTTSFEPGQMSVAERTMDYARKVMQGKIRDTTLFFFHRQASEEWAITKQDGTVDQAALRGAIVEASGPAKVEWSNLYKIEEQWQDPDADLAYLERTWLNWPKTRSSSAFDVEKFKDLEMSQYRIPEGALCVLGFDGSRYRDATGLIVTEVETGHQEVFGAWENRQDLPGWEVPKEEVMAAVREAFRRFEIWRMYADPYWWESEIAQLEGEFGDKVIVTFRTPLLRLMSDALIAFKHAIDQAELSHDGDPQYIEHVGHARRKDTKSLFEDGSPRWFITKERDDSPFKIDLAMAGVLSWQARLDAVGAGAKPTRPKGHGIYVPAGAESESETV